MKTSLLLRILKSNYIRLILLLTVLHVLFNTVLSNFSRVDYLIIVFLFFIPLIDENTIFQYSAIFGLYNDYLLDAHMGTGILLFLFFAVLKIVSGMFLDLKKLSYKLILSIVIIVLFTLFNLFYFGYKMPESFLYGLFGIVFDFTVYVAVFLILELISAFSTVKR